MAPRPATSRSYAQTYLNRGLTALCQLNLYKDRKPKVGLGKLSERALDLHKIYLPLQASGPAMKEAAWRALKRLVYSFPHLAGAST